MWRLGATAVALLALGAQASPRKTLRLASTNASKAGESEVEADMDALDLATESVDKTLPAPRAAKPAEKLPRIERRAPVAPKKGPSLPDPSLSVLSKHNLDLSGDADAAEALLAKGDAAAEAKLQARHLKELERDAPAKVSRVAPVPQANELSGPLSLAHDIEGLRDEETEKDQADQKEDSGPLSAAAERQALEVKRSPIKKRADLDEVEKLTEEAKTDSQ